MSVASSFAPSPSFLKLLAHDLRWNILVLLAGSDYCVREIVRLLRGSMRFCMAIRRGQVYDQAADSRGK
jgi:hypothetical protein